MGASFGKQFGYDGAMVIGTSFEKGAKEFGSFKKGATSIGTSFETGMYFIACSIVVAATVTVTWPSFVKSIEYGTVELRKYLSSNVQAKPTKTPPLHIACTNGNFDIVQYLLSLENDNYDVNRVDGNGKTALDLAIENNHGDIVKLLLQHRNTIISNKSIDDDCTVERGDRKRIEGTPQR